MSQTSETSAILHAQDEGYKAYLDGLGIPDCPYRSDPQLREAWARGYAASRTDRARANREATTPETN